MNLLLLALPAFASVPQYQISSQVISGKKIIASPRVVVNEGKTAEISDTGSQSQLKITVTPFTQGSVVRLKYSMSYHSGAINVNSERELLAVPGKEQSFTVAAGKQRLLVKVEADLVTN